LQPLLLQKLFQNVQQIWNDKQLQKLENFGKFINWMVEIPQQWQRQDKEDLIYRSGKIQRSN
jgi:hypothetical protein